MKHVAKFYAWLEINENTPIQTKLLVLDSCVFNAVLYGCETWGDITNIQDELISIEIKLLKRILNIKKGTSTTLVYYELKRPIITAKIKDKQYNFFKKLSNLSEHEAIIINTIKLCHQSDFLKYYRNILRTTHGQPRK